MAEGLQQVMCEYSEPDFANVFVENLGDKDNTSKFIQRLENYVNELEKLSENAETQKFLQIMKMLIQR